MSLTLAQEMERFIEFTSKYPDDAEFSDDGDPIVPGGRNILEAYRRWLRESGIRSNPIDQHSFYGMCLDVSIDDGLVWEMIQNPDPWLMVIKPHALRIPFVNASTVNARHHRAIEVFTDFLQTDPKLDFIASYTRKEYGCQPQPSANKPE